MVWIKGFCLWVLLYGFLSFICWLGDNDSTRDQHGCHHDPSTLPPDWDEMDDAEDAMLDDDDDEAAEAWKQC